MSDDILKLYKSITSKNNQQQNKPEIEQTNTELINTDKTKIKSQINYLNINLNDFLNISKQPVIQNQSRIFENENSENLKRKREKCSKGLRHFSMKVCEKVKQKSITTYNQVAEELVNEYCLNQSSNGQNLSLQNDFMSYDQKNVRRRVYDALNVLMAMNIISKEKKEIRWIGLPCNTKQECQDLEAEKKTRQASIEQKSELLKNLIIEQIALKSLIERNKKNNENVNSKKIQLPFITLNADSKTMIDCSISGDKKEYSIQLDNTFEIKSDKDVLKNLGLTHGLGEVKQKNNDEYKDVISKVPEAFQPYVVQLIESNNLEPICFDQSQFPDFSKVLKPDLFEIKSVRSSKKNSKTASKTDNLLDMANIKDEDSNDKNEDTDTNGGEESDEENSFENFEDDDDCDEEEIEDQIGDDDEEDESSDD